MRLKNNRFKVHLHQLDVTLKPNAFAKYASTHFCIKTSSSRLTHSFLEREQLKSKAKRIKIPGMRSHESFFYFLKEHLKTISKQS